MSVEGRGSSLGLRWSATALGGQLQGWVRFQHGLCRSNPSGIGRDARRYDRISRPDPVREDGNRAGHPTGRDGLCQRTAGDYESPGGETAKCRHPLLTI